MSSNLPWMWFAMRASGITAWTLLSATIMWGLLLRTRILSAGSPVRLMNMHKYLGILALLTLAVHLVTVLLDPTLGFTWANVLIPFTAAWKPLALATGIIAAYLMVPVQVVARIRARMGKSGAKWFTPLAPDRVCRVAARDSSLCDSRHRCTRSRIDHAHLIGHARDRAAAHCTWLGPPRLLRQAGSVPTGVSR
jgi:hypothetical protein